MKTLPIIYSQRDTRWASQRLGTVNGSTIGGFGCYVTSMATTACYFGHTITPAQLDDIMTNKNWYVDGNLMSDNNLEKAFSDIKYQQSIDYSNSPADLSKLQTLLQDPAVMVILEVDFNPSLQGVQTHFVVAVDCDGSGVTIADPWPLPNEQQICNINKYGDPKTTIQKFVVYKGTPTSGNMYKGYNLGNSDSMKVAVDILVRVQAGEFVDKSKYDADTQTLNQKLNDTNTKLGQANSLLEIKDGEIANLKKQIVSTPTTTPQNPSNLDDLTKFNSINKIATKFHFFYTGDFKKIADLSKV